MLRNSWLIDMGFVVQAATDGGRFKLDYIAAHTLLERRLGRTDAQVFNSIDPVIGVPRGLEAFYGVLERHGFEVNLTEMTGDPAAGTHRQQGVDEALINELDRAAADPDTDSIILTSGDAHFLPAIEDARDTHGKRTILFAYDVNVSEGLKAAVDEFWAFEAYESALARTR